jgi:hypothetical protein
VDLQWRPCAAASAIVDRISLNREAAMLNRRTFMQLVAGAAGGLLTAVVRRPPKLCMIIGFGRSRPISVLDWSNAVGAAAWA